MCNAHRHNPGCQCGFGPPFRTTGSIGSAREWAEDIIEEPPLARQGLEELGWPERSIEEFLAEYSRLLETGLSEDTLVVRINEMLGRHRTVERRVVKERLRVPLFRFSAPKVTGASVKYSEQYGDRRRRSWWARIFGLGTGGSQEISYRTEHCYTATNGQCKLIYVPVPLRIAEVDVMEDGRKIGEGLRAQVELPKAKNQCWTTGRGSRALKLEECACTDSVVAEELFDYQLADDEGEPTRSQRTWAVNIEREVSLGLTKAFGAEVRVRIGRDRAMGLEFELPPGHDYYGGKGGGLLWWTAP